MVVVDDFVVDECATEGTLWHHITGIKVLAFLPQSRDTFSLHRIFRNKR